ncbi:Inner membrane transport protein YdhP [Clavibacter michiganensis subsp. michiganensis]|uniref:Inner membrane transport protein YdhP n=1 Tax=Clavibacter michiganensis subsp. michiganensis TaxID=33013 RepID=A0A251XGK9_CLAMM|nr:Inner membrane transport protein YdhP [Clavibacter michiganensis subsp. michiganensis]OUE01337.1 Inner membrane transport protein YdhP [Clavibacter michiganensis subsp. michiganensis]
MGGFAIGTTEFVAMGLLPQLAADLLPEVAARSTEAANAQAGTLISAYALGVVVGAPTIAAASARAPRRKLLLWLLLAFTLGPSSARSSRASASWSSPASSRACRTAPTSASRRSSPRS